MKHLNTNGSSIIYVLIVFVILGIFSASSFQIISNISKSGETVAAKIELENTRNKIKFLLANSNLCKSRLVVPGFNPTPGVVHYPLIKDDLGQVFLTDGTVINGFKYSVTMTASPFGRQGAPFAPSPRSLGVLNITATPQSLGRTFIASPKPLSFNIFFEGNPISFCSIQTMFTQILGPPGMANPKSSVECLDVGGRPVEISKYKDASGNISSFTPTYMSCFIPATSLMPTGCAAIGKLLAQSQTNPGEGWASDPLAQQQFIGIAAAGNVTYAEASYCY